MDWAGGTGQTASGAVIGAQVCSGYIYSDNVGWINLGSGSPTNGIQYQNNSATDFGVNLDGSGNLRGYAYGANIGWINFESIGAPAINLTTGTLSGSIWSANCGWISLSNAVAYVQTDIGNLPPTIITSSLPGATINTGYNQVLAWSGGTAPLTWTLANGSLPAGLSLSSSGGVISGTPTAAGTASFTVQVTDGNGGSATQAFTLIVSPPPTITTSSLPNATMNIGYNQTLAENGGTAPLSWTLVIGSLPSGLSLSSGGVISGTPGSAGMASFTVQVTDNNGASASQSYNLIVNPFPMITTGSLPGATLNTGYNQTLAGSGGTAPLTWTLVNGSLPAGLSLSGGGVLSGTPTTTGTATFTVQVTDANGASTTQSYTIIITPPTTIDAINRYAYGANVGWMDWYANGTNGAVIGENVCSGNIYSANAGWINLGSGSPANGIYYQNLSANDFGVNQDGLGNLRGYAYGANIGWINFENTGAPQVNLRTGDFSGYVWSANCGWISLSNAVAYVQTDTIAPGPLAPDGLPAAWLLANFGTTNVNPNADPTGKGMTIAQDYLAGTDPNNVNSILKITGQSFSSGGTSAMLTWTSVPTRYYHIQETSSLSSSNWINNNVGLISPQGTVTTSSIADASAANRFYRIQAVRPLTQ